MSSANLSLTLPPFLQPGDRVTVISTSGALKEMAAFEKGLDVWRSRGYQVELGKSWDQREGYLAGTDTARRQALLAAWKDPDCKAILCTRGGYGSMRLLENWQWPADVTPKWLIGFSDITGLLWSLATVGITGIHGPVLTTLDDEPAWSKQRLFDAVEGRSLETLTGNGWGGGMVQGHLLPANLTVATHLLATPLQPNLDGVILALEDVTEAPYRIDRLLTHWRLLGVFEKVAGIALGRFSRCYAPAGTNSWTIEEVLRDRFGDLGIPIVSDLPFGHDGVNAALPVGARVELNAEQGTLTFL
ncbi:MAG: LD-carboxypeptidase [Snowella sp.]|nr:LD-carboxypeptidase [Snowella sp.]